MYGRFCCLSTYNEVRVESEGLPDFLDSKQENVSLNSPTLDVVIYWF